MVEHKLVTWKCTQYQYGILVNFGEWLGLGKTANKTAINWSLYLYAHIILKNHI